MRVDEKIPLVLNGGSIAACLFDYGVRLHGVQLHSFACFKLTGDSCSDGIE